MVFYLFSRYPQEQSFWPCKYKKHLNTPKKFEKIEIFFSIFKFSTQKLKKKNQREFENRKSINSVIHLEIEVEDLINFNQNPSTLPTTSSLVPLLPKILPKTIRTVPDDGITRIYETSNEIFHKY